MGSNCERHCWKEKRAKLSRNFVKEPGLSPRRGTAPPFSRLCGLLLYYCIISSLQRTEHAASAVRLLQNCNWSEFEAAYTMLQCVSQVKRLAKPGTLLKKVRLILPFGHTPKLTSSKKRGSSQTLSSSFSEVLTLAVTQKRVSFGVTRSCATSPRERIVFGIDYGSNLAKLAVYDRNVARPRVLLNPEDGNVPYWHTAVAYEKKSESLVTGKRAKEIVRTFCGRSFSVASGPCQSPVQLNNGPLVHPT